MKQINLLFKVLQKTGTSLFVGSILLFAACNSETEPELDIHAVKTTYRAIAKDDTATLSVIMNEKAFYGQLEINYRGLYKDSGDVNGVLKGDTLMGTFHYQSYGIDQKYRIPIALLKKEDKLLMGVGKMIIKMNMTFFAKNVPIDYKNPPFSFEKTQ